MSRRRKIMLFGEIGVGKTSLIRRLVLDKFDEAYGSTFGFDIYKWDVTDAGPGRDQRVELVIWDTDGNVGVGIFDRPMYLEGISAALFVGDTTRPETHATMLKLAGVFAAQFPAREVAFLMNKADLAGDRAIPADVAAAAHACFMTSAKTGENVAAAFTAIATTVLRRDV